MKWMGRSWSSEVKKFNFKQIRQTKCEAKLNKAESNRAKPSRFGSTLSPRSHAKPRYFRLNFLVQFKFIFSLDLDYPKAAKNDQKIAFRNTINPLINNTSFCQIWLYDSQRKIQFWTR